MHKLEHAFQPATCVWDGMFVKVDASSQLDSASNEGRQGVSYPWSTSEELVPGCLQELSVQGQRNRSAACKQKGGSANSELHIEVLGSEKMDHAGYPALLFCHLLHIALLEALARVAGHSDAGVLLILDEDMAQPQDVIHMLRRAYHSLVLENAVD